MLLGALRRYFWGSKKGALDLLRTPGEVASGGSKKVFFCDSLVFSGSKEVCVPSRVLGFLEGFPLF